MDRVLGLTAAVWLALTGIAQAAGPPVPAPVQPIAVPAGSPLRGIEFSRLDVRIANGSPLGTTAVGLVCYPTTRAYYQSPKDVLTDQYLTVFNDVMKAAGFKVAGDTTNMFESGSGSGDYAIGGAITAAYVEICAPMILLRTGDARTKGKVVYSVEWQIYSRLQREVVARVQTSGGVELKEPGDPYAPMNRAFAENVKALANAQAFRDLAIGGPLVPTAVGATAAPALSAVASAPAATAARPTIELGVPSRKPTSLAETAGSVVTVFAGEGHGSGVLVSDQGYVFTNQHVTGGAKYVKLRWNDNSETVGEVLREDKGRDVALIKTDARGRLPLTLLRNEPALGQEVYAIGSPLNEKLSGTVTRGIVSASRRLYGGYAWVQSDVTVNPGNSGGPLVTKDGEVVALTVIGIQPDGVPTGINLFIPAADAMDFLGVR